MVIRLHTDFGELVKVALKTGRGVRKEVGGLRGMGAVGILWPLCVFGCTVLVIMEGISVRDCRVLGFCAVGTVG
jgi:hypothetical protein